MTRQNHICVHSGSIDSGSWGYGFAVAKNSPFARHPWNLKVLTNNTGSFLKSLGPVMGKIYHIPLIAYYTGCSFISTFCYYIIIIIIININNIYLQIIRSFHKKRIKSLKSIQANKKSQ